MLGLSNFQRTGMGQDISALGSLGALRQGLTTSSINSTSTSSIKQAAYEPYGRLITIR